MSLHLLLRSILRNWHIVAEDFLLTAVISALMLATGLLSHGVIVPYQLTPLLALNSSLSVAKSFIPPTVPLICAATSIVVVILGRRLGAHRSERGTAAMILAGTLPAIGGLLEAVSYARDLNEELSYSNIHIDSVVSSIQHSISIQLDSISIGCWHAAVVLLAIGAIATVKWPLASVSLGTLTVVVFIGIGAITLRLTIGPEGDRVDIAAISVFAVAIVLVTLVRRECSSHTLAYLSLALGLAFVEVGGRLASMRELSNSIESVHMYADNHPLFMSAYKVTTVQRAVTPQDYAARSICRAYFAVFAPFLVVVATVVAGTWRKTKFNWRPKSAWTVGAVAAALIVLGLDANSLRTTGTIRRLEAIKARLSQLFSDVSETSNARELGKYVPVALSGPVVKIDVAGRPRWIPCDEAAPVYGSKSPILVVLPDLQLADLIHVLTPSGVNGDHDYRWLTVNNISAETWFGAFDCLRALVDRNLIISDVALEPSLRIYAGSESAIGKPEWTGALIQGETALLFPLSQTEAGYQIRPSCVITRELKDLYADTKQTTNSLVVVWDSDVSVRTVTRIIRRLSDSGFHKFAIGTGRETEKTLTNAFRMLSRRAHSASDEAKQAFRTVVRESQLTTQDMELVEGALIGARIDIFSDGFLTPQKMGLDMRVKDEGPEITLSVNSTRDKIQTGRLFTVERRSGVVSESTPPIASTHSNRFAGPSPTRAN